MCDKTKIQVTFNNTYKIQYNDLMDNAIGEVI